jgi:GT2 family glycosyltransferase
MTAEIDSAGSRNTAVPVSVIIVNYNAGVMLTECVRSVLRSSIPVEVCVSDNGSEDNSIAYLRAALNSHPALTIIENNANLGFAKGNNVALSSCRGEYVLFLNPDCIIQPDTLEQMVSVMQRHSDVGMAGCLLLNPDGTEQAGCRRYVPTPWRSVVRLLKLDKVIKDHPRFQSFVMTGLPLPPEPVPIEALSGAFMFVRRRAINEVGPMDPRYFLHCEDLDWCMRLREAGWKILFVPHVHVVHWQGFSSKTHPIKVEFYKHCGMVRFYRKFFRRRYPGILLYLVMVAVWLRFLAKSIWVTLNSPLRLRRIPRVKLPVQQAMQADRSRDA